MTPDRVVCNNVHYTIVNWNCLSSEQLSKETDPQVQQSREAQEELQQRINRIVEPLDVIM